MWCLIILLLCRKVKLLTCRDTQEIPWWDTGSTLTNSQNAFGFHYWKLPRCLSVVERSGVGSCSFPSFGKLELFFLIVFFLYFAGVCASVTINKQNEAIICNKLSCLFCPPSESHFNKVTANNPFHEQVVAYDSALNVDMLVFSSVKFFIIVFQMSCRL